MANKFVKGALVAAGILAGASAAYAKPAELDSFDYASQRNVPKIDGKCLAGTIRNYSLLDNGSIAQSDKDRVNFLPLWFYDIDNDGKFGKAEIEAMKKGIPVFMSDEFNNMANEKVRNFLELTQIYNSLQASDAETIKDCRKRISELEEQIANSKNQPIQVPQPTAQSQPATPSSVQKKDSLYPSIILQATTNASDVFGAGAGIGLGDSKVRMALIADIALGLDKDKLETYSSPLSAGRTAYGQIDLKNRFAAGLSLEGMLNVAGPFSLFADFGFCYSNDIKTTTEKILDKYGVALKSNVNSASDRQIFGKIAGGAKVGPVRIFAGYDKMNGAFGGVGAEFDLK